MPKVDDYSFRLNLAQVPNTEDPDLLTALLPIHSAVHNLALQLDLYVGRFIEPSTNYSQLGTMNINSAGFNRFYCQANATITTGQLVKLTASGITVKADLAKADSINTPSRAIYLGTTTLASGDWAEFILSPTLYTTTGLTPGSTYYLSPGTSGGITITRPTTVGQIIQEVGFAISDTVLYCKPNQPVILL